MKRQAFITMVLVLWFLQTAAAHAQQTEVLRVVTIESRSTNRFAFGENCAFETAHLPKEPLRLRLIRGTKANLIAYGHDPLRARNGCVEYYSLIVRPTRDEDVLDLGFDLREGWLDGKANGHFVVVAELDDRPRGPMWEPDRLRLAAGQPIAEYFDAGIDVTVIAPEYVTVSVPGRFNPVEIKQGCAQTRYEPGPPVTFQAESTAVVRERIIAGWW